MNVQCCVCHRVKADGEWRDAANARPPISHSYCPACHELLRVRLHNERAATTQPAAVPPMLPYFA